MLDVNIIRENPDKVREGVQKKGVDPKLVDDFLAVDEKWRGVTAFLDEARAKQNEVTKSIQGSPSTSLREDAKRLKARVTELESEVRSLEEERSGILNNLPNVPYEDVVVGDGEEGNKVLRKEGKPTKFDFEIKDYLTLAQDLGIVDVKKAAEVSGARFGYLLGEAALLEFALLQLAFDTLLKEGFQPVVPPVMIRPEVYKAIGRLAADQEDDRFYIERDEKFLVGTSEHTIIPIMMNETRSAKDLPIRYVGFSSAFRREAGSYGKDTKGILRVHQFDKIEMISFTEEGKSDEEFDFLFSMQEKMWKALKIPYQVVLICTGDMGWTDAKQYDIEAWMPSQDCYRETNSCSNTTDFQTRGIRARYKDGGETKYMHSLNATGFAIGRTIIAILENYQRKDGSIEIPKVLQKYVGKKIIH